MRICKCALVAAVLTVWIPRLVAGQYAADQGKALRGLTKVYLNFAEPNGKMPLTSREELFNTASLELRKAGIRVTTDSADIDEQTDAVLNLTLFVTTGLSDHVMLRMDVEQKVSLVRTNEVLQLVTWFHEEAVGAASWRTSAPSLTTKGVNKLLADWLEANGR